MIDNSELMAQEMMEKVVELLPTYKAKQIKWLFKKIHQDIDRRKACGLGWKPSHKKRPPNVKDEING